MEEDDIPIGLTPIGITPDGRQRVFNFGQSMMDKMGEMDSMDEELNNREEDYSDDDFDGQDPDETQLQMIEEEIKQKT